VRGNRTLIPKHTTSRTLGGPIIDIDVFVLFLNVKTFLKMRCVKILVNTWGSIISIGGCLLTKESYLWSPVIVSICFLKGAFVCNFVRNINIWGDTKYYMVQLIQ
jgi:hypothetical protein